MDAVNCKYCQKKLDGTCSNNNADKSNCAAQLLTEEGWLELGYAVLSNGDKIKVE